MKEIPGKTLAIVGNGFDLAHGLKTSYNDFFKDYILRKLIEASKNLENRNTDDGLFRVCYGKSPELVDKDILEYKEYTFSDLITKIKNNPHLDIIPLTELAKRLLKTFNSWVDIENAYYRELKKIISTYYNEKTLSHLDEDSGNLKSAISQLNKQMTLLSNELENYLHNNCNKSNRLNDFNYEFLLTHYWEYDKQLKPHDMNGENHEIYFLDFNYTNTLSQYMSSRQPNIKFNINKIHGELKSGRNPMIFGFGDERDSDYNKIENIHLDDAFEKIKSFGYFKTNNYNNLLNFIDTSDYTVVILGHSCGLSDRVLLSTVFEHKNCKKIRICYYENEEGINDFTSKTYQISRHFEDKKLMRERIMPFRNNDFDKVPQNNIT